MSLHRLFTNYRSHPHRGEHLINHEGLEELEEELKNNLLLCFKTSLTSCSSW